MAASPNPSRADALRAQILDLVARVPRGGLRARAVPGRARPRVPVAGRVFDADEMRHLVDASLDFWLTTGRFAAQFEREFAALVGVAPRACSSTPARRANLVARRAP